VVRALLIGDMRGFSKLPDEQLPASRVVMTSLAHVPIDTGPRSNTATLGVTP